MLQINEVCSITLALASKHFSNYLWSMHHCRHYITSFFTIKKLQKCDCIKNKTTIHFNHIPVVALLLLIFLIKGNSPLPAIQMINTNESNSTLQMRNFNQKIFINEGSGSHAALSSSEDKTNRHAKFWKRLSIVYAGTLTPPCK